MQGDLGGWEEGSMHPSLGQVKQTLAPSKAKTVRENSCYHGVPITHGKTEAGLGNHMVSSIL